MPPRVISPQLQKQRDAQSRKKVPGIRHPLLLSFLAGKLAFKHIYKDDDSLYEAIKSTPIFANANSKNAFSGGFWGLGWGADRSTAKFCIEIQMRARENLHIARLYQYWTELPFHVVIGCAIVDISGVMQLTLGRVKVASPTLIWRMSCKDVVSICTGFFWITSSPLVELLLAPRLCRQEEPIRLKANFPVFNVFV